MESYPFKEVETPWNRTLIIDAGALASKRHVIYGFLEADVTEAKRIIHQSALGSTPETSLSFTAYIAHCVAKTVAENPAVQAYRKGGCRSRKLVIFQDVDVVIMVEPRENETAFPHIIRQANKKSVLEISQEIRHVKNNPQSSGQQYDKKALQMFAKLPKWLRMMIYQQMSKDPQAVRQRQGTVILTSVGMFGKKEGGRGSGGGWGLTFLPMHTLGITLGGIQRKPVVVAGSGENENEHENHEDIAVRDMMCITVAFDHDIVDGAPGARFASNLIDAIERHDSLSSLNDT